MELFHRVASDLSAQLHRQTKQNKIRDNFHPSVLSQMGESLQSLQSLKLFNKFITAIKQHSELKYIGYYFRSH